MPRSGDPVTLRRRSPPDSPFEDFSASVGGKKNRHEYSWQDRQVPSPVNRRLRAVSSESGRVEPAGGRQQEPASGLLTTATNNHIGSTGRVTISGRPAGRKGVNQTCFTRKDDRSIRSESRLPEFLLLNANEMFLKCSSTV